MYLVTVPVWSFLLLAGTLLLGFRAGTVTLLSVESVKIATFYLSALIFCLSAAAQIVMIPRAVRRLVSIPRDARGIAIAEISVGLIL